MNLTFLRGACTIIEAGGKRILTDPWLMDGIYDGAWGHYPEFHDWELDWNVDYIYVSHVHPDHFDAATMRKLKVLGCKAPALIHTYPTKFLKKHIEDCGYECIELEHAKPFSLGNSVRLSIYGADNCDPAACGNFFGCAMPGVRGTQVDSMAVLTDGHRTIVNINDCPWGLSANLAHKIGQEFNVDLALIAYAGAGPYPQCFKMSIADKAKQAVQKRLEFLDGVKNFARALGALRVFPFAGDYQLCGKLSSLNEYRGVPEVIDVYRHLAKHGFDTLPINPGESSDIDANGSAISDMSDERRAYVDLVLSKRKLDYEDDPMPSQAELNRLIWPAFDRFHKKRVEYGLRAKATAYIKIDDGYYLAIPPDGQPMYSSGPVAYPHVVIETDGRMLYRLLKGPKFAHWNNAQIGSHITFDRKPMDLYEPGLYHLLSFFHV